MTGHQDHIAWHRRATLLRRLAEEQRRPTPFELWMAEQATDEDAVETILDLYNDYRDWLSVHDIDHPITIWAFKALLAGNGLEVAPLDPRGRACRKGIRLGVTPRCRPDLPRAARLASHPPRGSGRVREALARVARLVGLRRAPAVDSAATDQAAEGPSPWLWSHDEAGNPRGALVRISEFLRRQALPDPRPAPPAPSDQSDPEART